MNIIALTIAFVCGAVLGFALSLFGVGLSETNNELRMKCDLLEKRLDELSK